MLADPKVGWFAASRSWCTGCGELYQDEVEATERALLVAWSAFGLTFGVTRAVRLWLRGERGPAGGGIVIRGRHIHHYNLNIALLTFVGAVALGGLERHRRHPLTITAYGSGVALIIDELALLIDLQDVYWAKDGRWSVDAAIGTITAGGVYLAAVTVSATSSGVARRPAPRRGRARPGRALLLRPPPLPSPAAAVRRQPRGRRPTPSVGSCPVPVECGRAVHLLRAHLPAAGGSQRSWTAVPPWWAATTAGRATCRR